MEGDHRVWPPEPGPRRTPPASAGDRERSDTGSGAGGGWGRPPEPPPAWGRRGRPYADEPVRPASQRQDPALGDRAPENPVRGDRARGDPGGDSGWGPLPDPPGQGLPRRDPPRHGLPRRDLPRQDRSSQDLPRGPSWQDPPHDDPRRPHPLDLDLDPALDPGTGPEFEEPAWSPRIRHDLGPAGEDRWDDALPPSAHLHGSPKDPSERGRRLGGKRLGRRVGIVLAALAAGAGLVA